MEERTRCSAYPFHFTICLSIARCDFSITCTHPCIEQSIWKHGTTEHVFCLSFVKLNCNKFCPEIDNERFSCRKPFRLDSSPSSRHSESIIALFNTHNNEMEFGNGQFLISLRANIPIQAPSRKWTNEVNCAFRSPCEAMGSTSLLWDLTRFTFTLFCHIRLRNYFLPAKSFLSPKNTRGHFQIVFLSSILISASLSPR